MYRSIYFDESENKIHLWGDGQHNDAGHQIFEYQPYAYVADSRGEHQTIDGVRCRMVESWSPEAVKMGMVFEHDVPPTTRFLIDKYTDTDDIANNNKILCLDIEVAKEERYSTPDKAENTITSIAWVATGDEYYTCLLLDTERRPGKYTDIIDIPLKKKVDGKIVDSGMKRVSAKIITFDNERALLRKFIMMYQDIGHNIITGWNVEFFDMPYLFNRMVRVLGYGLADMLSPAKICKKRYTKFGEAIIIAGVTVLDYLALYQKFTYTDQPNFRLDTIAKFELHRGKIEYEGDLDHLYKTDIVKFAIYNIVDVELVIALEEKKQLIQTALGICHTGHCQHSDVQFTSRYLDGAALTYCRRNNVVASANMAGSSSEKAKGAFVKKPVPGMYKWIYDLDLTSLYPMNIITLNISPETKYAKIIAWDEDEYIKGTDRPYVLLLYKDETATGKFNDVFSGVKKANQIEIKGSKALRAFAKEKNLSIASNGCMYTLDKQGVIPAILSMWFDDRKRFKDLKKKYEIENDHAKATLYDLKQLITKIMLNSFYGVLLLPAFRFYDKDNGEAVTLTGQSVIQWATRAADYYYNKEIGTKNEKYCIYTDTDSIFEPIEPIFVHRHGPMENYTDNEIIEKARVIVGEVQDFVNKSYDRYAKEFHNVESHRWDIKQELIAKRALWVGTINPKTGKFEGVKKRYAQWIVDEDGRRVDYMDVKGLDVVRSNFPSKFRQFMKSVLTDLLNDAKRDDMNSKVREFKSHLEEIDLKNVMLPTGVKNIDKFETGVLGKRDKGTPIHVKAAMNYNDMLTMLNIQNIPPIQDGEKIVWAYLKPNKYGFDTMALKGFEDPEAIEKFVDEHIDKNAIFEKRLKNQLTNFWLSMGWGQIQMNSLASKFFKF